MSEPKIRGGIVEGAPWLRWQCVDGIVTFGPAQPAAPDATAGDGLREAQSQLYALLGSRTSTPLGAEWTHERLRRLVSDVLALPALRDVLAAAARDAERVASVKEIRDALAETIAEADAEAPGVRQVINPTVLLTWLDAALDPS